MHRGDTLTVHKMAEYFGQRHTLDLLCHAPATPEDAEHAPPHVHRLVTPRFSKARAAGRVGLAAFSSRPFQVAWCTSRALRSAADQLLAENDYDAAIVYYLRPAPCLEGLNGRVKPIRIAALQLSLATEWARAAEHARRPWTRLLRRIEAKRLARYETELFQRFDRCLVISKHDRDRIRGHIPEKVFFNPHGVDTRKYAPRADIPVEPNRIIFTGRMAFHPNGDAATWFAKDIFPLIRERVPEAQFMIVGANPPPAVKALEREAGIVVTGTVPSIVDYLATAAVAVDPLRVGAGLQNKVLEAMSMGKPVVMSTVANEGIGAHDNDNALVRDDPESFAQAVISLLNEPSTRQSIGERARQWICERWTWKYHFERLEAMIEALVAARQNT